MKVVFYILCRSGLRLITWRVWRRRWRRVSPDPVRPVWAPPRRISRPPRPLRPILPSSNKQNEIIYSCHSLLNLLLLQLNGFGYVLEKICKLWFGTRISNVRIFCQRRIQDFLEEAVNSTMRVHQPIISQNFGENCMKTKEFGPWGGIR